MCTYCECKCECRCDCKKRYRCKTNLYRTICRRKRLSTLKDAIDAASPVIKETLETADPLTVFGPINKAFDDFVVGSCGTLDETLLYHVVPEYLSSKKLENDVLYPTLREGKKVRANVYKRPIFNNVITVNGAKVVKGDIRATNGVLHEINQVLCPPDKNILELALETPELSTLVVAVQAASPSIAQALAEADPLTLFAPTNEAFVKLDEELKRCYDSSLEEVLENTELLDAILLYHVLGQTVFSVAIKEGLTWGIETLQGETIDLKNRCHKIKIVDQLCRRSKVIHPDILATNGVVHLINRVLLPFEPTIY